MTSETTIVSLETRKEICSPGDATLNVTLFNDGATPVALDLYRGTNPSLSLQIKDAQDRPVLLPPPSVPITDNQRTAERILQPGERHRFVMAGFFDAGQPAGTYRVRYHYTDFNAPGGRQRTLTSDWVNISLTVAQLPRPEDISLAAKGCLYRILCFFFPKKCDKVVSTEVDKAISETITNAPPPNQGWNGTYGWHARFRLTLDQPRCRVTATVKVRVTGAVTDAQKTAWKNAIEGKWSNRFKLCCKENCCKSCCPRGYTIICDLQFVQSGEHQVVNAGATTVNMNNWGAADNVDVTHEFGHMLGNKEEYFTVDGTDYGAPRRADGNVMNNPANDPVPSHFNLIKEETEKLLGAGTRCTVKRVNEAC